MNHMFQRQKHKTTSFIKNRWGFTLIELLVVIAIVGLLATLAIVALQNAREKSRDTRRKGDLKQVYTALDLYLSGPGNGLYPIQNGSFACFSASLTDLVTENLMAGLPSDPLPERVSVATGCYNYRSDSGTDYKIRTNLETDDSLMASDGGSSDLWYEIFTPGAQAW